MSSRERFDARRAWERIRARLLGYKASHRWRAAAGPLSAAVVTLADQGWKPWRPDRWIDPSGKVWVITPNGDRAPLLDAFTASVDLSLWRKASLYHNGAGLEGGADLTVLKKRLSAEKRKEKGLAGLLGAVATSSCWTCARRHASYPQESPTCPRCKRCPETDWHRHWECPANVPEANPAKNKYLRLAEEAALPASREVPCLWLRGITPAATTYVEPPPEQQPVQRFGSMEPAHGSRYYLDGSGGEHTSSKRLRRCGWAVVHMVGEQPVGGMSGALPGVSQTVPRSELLALVQLLEDHGPEIARSGAGIVSDCAYVVTGAQYRLVSLVSATRPLANQDLWQRLPAAIWAADCPESRLDFGQPDSQS